MNKSKLYKIKKDKLKSWLLWCKKINTEYKEEAELTLNDEGIQHEGFITFNIGKKYYTLGISLEGANSIKKSDPTLPLNIAHKEKIKECLEPVSKLDFSYFLSSK